MRYLFARQHVAGGRRLEGKRGAARRDRAAAGLRDRGVAWERDVLPSRVAELRPALARRAVPRGRGRLGAALAAEDDRHAAAASSPQRATPITLALRRDLGWLLESVRGVEQPEDPTTGAARGDARRAARSTARSSSTTWRPRAGSCRRSSKRRCGISSRAGSSRATASRRCGRS